MPGFGLCDFCDRKLVGYTSMHMFLYCSEHAEKAETMFVRNMEEMEKDMCQLCIGQSEPGECPCWE